MSAAPVHLRDSEMGRRETSTMVRGCRETAGSVAPPQSLLVFPDKIKRELTDQRLSEVTGQGHIPISDNPIRGICSVLLLAQTCALTPVDMGGTRSISRDCAGHRSFLRFTPTSYSIASRRIRLTPISLVSAAALVVLHTPQERRARSRHILRSRIIGNWEFAIWS